MSLLIDSCDNFFYRYDLQNEGYTQNTCKICILNEECKCVPYVGIDD